MALSSHARVTSSKSCKPPGWWTSGLVVVVNLELLVNSNIRTPELGLDKTLNSQFSFYSDSMKPSLTRPVNLSDASKYLLWQLDIFLSNLDTSIQLFLRYPLQKIYLSAIFLSVKVWWLLYTTRQLRRKDFFCKRDRLGLFSDRELYINKRTFIDIESQGYARIFFTLHIVWFWVWVLYFLRGMIWICCVKKSLE